MTQENPQNPIQKAHLEGVEMFREKFVLETNNGKILSCKHLGKKTILEDLESFLTTYAESILNAALEAGPGEINKQTLKVASAKLRKLRLTQQYGDREGELATVKSCFQAGLGGLYDDSAIEYMLEFGIKYYLNELSHSAIDEGIKEIKKGDL